MVSTRMYLQRFSCIGDTNEPHFHKGHIKVSGTYFFSKRYAQHFLWNFLTFSSAHHQPSFNNWPLPTIIERARHDEIQLRFRTLLHVVRISFLAVASRFSCFSLSFLLLVVLLSNCVFFFATVTCFFSSVNRSRLYPICCTYHNPIPTTCNRENHRLMTIHLSWV